MTTIPDFTEAERKRIPVILLERYGKIIPIQLADSELQLGADPADLSLCPTIYWNERGAHFIVCKVGESRYRCLFFYSDAEQYGTGRAGMNAARTSSCAKWGRAATAACFSIPMPSNTAQAATNTTISIPASSHCCKCSRTTNTSLPISLPAPPLPI